MLEIALPGFPSRPLGIGLPLPFGEWRRLPFADSEFLFQALDLLLQPRIFRLQTLDLTLQFFHLFRLIVGLRCFGPIHPPYIKPTPLICPEKTSEDLPCPLINYRVSIRTKTLHCPSSPNYG